MSSGFQGRSGAVDIIQVRVGDLAGAAHKPAAAFEVEFGGPALANDSA